VRPFGLRWQKIQNSWGSSVLEIKKPSGPAELLLQGLMIKPEKGTGLKFTM
jgi:hypothetical protein